MDWIKISLTEKQIKEIKETEKQIKKVQLLKRLQCLKLKNEGWKHEKLAKFLGVCIDTITNWLKAFNKDGIKGLIEWGYEGKPSQLTEEHKAQLKERHTEKPFDTAKEAKYYIEEHFGMKFHLHWVQKLLKKNFDCHTKKQP